MFTYLKLQNLTFVPYLDNFLITAASPLLSSQIHQTICLLRNLSSILNFKKADLIPAHEKMFFWGFFFFFSELQKTSYFAPPRENTLYSRENANVSKEKKLFYPRGYVHPWGDVLLHSHSSLESISFPSLQAQILSWNKSQSSLDKKRELPPGVRNWWNQKFEPNLTREC